MTIRRFLLTAAVLVSALGFATPASAQGIEFSGGVNVAQLSGDAIQNAARNIGPNFGVDLVLPLGPIGLNLGADWSSKGVEGVLDGVQQSSIIDLSYIEIPVHMRIPLVGAGPIRLNLVLGPTIGINTGCEITLQAASVDACSDAVQNFEVRKLDWSGAAGLGVSVGLGGIAYAGADVKYTLGLTSISEQVASDIKNRAFAVQAHLGFDLF